jgi:Flp pilus assembly protein CpaB
MAKQSPMQWIPSGGVLAAAIGAGLLAAILINVYASNIRSQYEDGSQSFYILTDDVAAGTQIQERNLKSLRIPKQLLPPISDAFKQAVTADDRGRMTVVGRKAPRLLKKDTFLWFPDFIDTGIVGIAKLPPGHELISIRIDPNTSLGAQLQPGSYVNIRGLFNISSDSRNPQFTPYDVMKNIQVRAIGGLTTAPEKGRSYDTIQIVIPSSQAKLMPEIQKLVQTGAFTVGIVEEGAAGEPKIEKEVLDFLRRPRTAASTSAPATARAPGTEPAPPPPAPEESAAPPVPAIP